ncbi:MAG: hypothetical protein IJU41_01840 [Clostridia bacterium]|nr:hypothetical protein [Clostridia bacterium]
MLYIGKKPQKTTNPWTVVLVVLSAIAGVAALTVVAYKLYQRFVPACIDCECEDFMDDEDAPDEPYVEVERDESAGEHEFEDQ